MSQASGYLIDTDVLSEIGKGERCDRRVAAWFESVDEKDLRLSVLVLGEIRKGIELLRPRDLGRAATIDRWLSQITGGFADRILPIDGSVANLWGQLAAQRTLPVIDGLLAATALAHDLVLATRNIKDFADSGARLLNPFAED